MKRKNYERPTMQVVRLRNKCQILAGSVLNVIRGDVYGDAVEEVWDDAEDARLYDAILFE